MDLLLRIAETNWTTFDFIQGESIEKKIIWWEKGRILKIKIDSQLVHKIYINNYEYIKVFFLVKF